MRERDPRIAHSPSNQGSSEVGVFKHIMLNGRWARCVGLCSLVMFVTPDHPLQAAEARRPVGPTRATAPAAHVVVLGDSLAVSPSRAAGFPPELQKRLKAAGFDWTVVNAGVKGDKTGQAMRRLATALTTDARILIVALGANDGLRGIEIAQVEMNLSTIIEHAQKQVPASCCAG